MSILRALDRRIGRRDTVALIAATGAATSGAERCSVEDEMPRIVSFEKPRSDKAASAELRQQTIDRTLYVGVVHAVDGVRLITTADTRRELVWQLAEYAREHGDDALRPDHARHLRGLLARGELEAAVELYFALVGRRWDEEWLVTAVVALNDRSNVAAVVGEVAFREALRGPRRLRDAS